MRSAFALRIISGIIIYNFGVQESLRTFLNPIFTERVIGKRQSYPFRLAALRQSTFPKGTALAVAGNFSAVPEGSPLGELARQRLKGCPSREKANRENPQIFPIGKYKNIIP